MARLLTQYSLRLERKKLLLRAWRRRRELSHVHGPLEFPQGPLVALCLRNEHPRLPHFFSYYRNLGIAHFLVVDNESSDGSAEWLADQPDCTVWRCFGSYKRARFGMDWINGLLNQHAQGRWVLTVDADELFVYPHMEHRPIRALTDWLDTQNLRAFGTLLLDLYPDQVETAQADAPPLEVLTHYDAGNYQFERNARYGHVWIQGGVRQRVFFADTPSKAPALNKIPLVKWSKGLAYVSSTHHLLPRGMNRVYDAYGGQKATGLLL
ncbi:MAG: glycosyltransferase family 2 protein, partial [Pseudomonadota bacterium]